jgi:hypothetical protein
VFEHFQVTVVKGRFFISKHINICRPEWRFFCKHCSYVQLDSKRNGTSNFIKHLSVNHRICKVSASVSGLSVVDLLRNVSLNISISSVSPRQSVIDWVVDCFLSFSSIEHKSFHRMIEAYSNKYAI